MTEEVTTQEEARRPSPDHSPSDRIRELIAKQEVWKHQFFDVLIEELAGLNGVDESQKMKFVLAMRDRTRKITLPK